MTGCNPTGASATPRSADATPPLRVAVAASGGRDSTALLHCTLRSAAALGIEVHALHVHHGLHPLADHWRQRLARQVQRWARAGCPVSFHWRELTGSPGRGESVEAWARTGRYAALAEMASELGCGLVLLGHHRLDQAETVLLQALRGAGAAGAAAMPAQAQRAGLVWARPWLDHSREAIEHYLSRHRLVPVDDPGNIDRRFARNRLRHDVWPVLQAAFPEAEASLAASARRSAEAVQCLRELYAMDAAACLRDDGLDVAAWLALSPARRAHLLRGFLTDAGAGRVPESLVQRLLKELPASTAGRWPLGPAWLGLHRGRLGVIAVTEVPAHSQRPCVQVLDLGTEGRHEVPGWGGAFEVTAEARPGLPAGLLSKLRCVERPAGARFSSAPGRPPRSLKKQFQAAGVAAWQRAAPCLYVDDELLFVPGLGVEAAWHPRLCPGGLQLRWVPHQGASGVAGSGA